jgi:hypothetical protein
LESFIKDGFFTKQSLLSRDACRRTLDATWQILSEQGITRDPATWRKAHGRRGVVKLRDEVENNEAIRDAIVNCTGVSEVVGDLVGTGYVNCGVRGVYPTLPIPRRISRPYEPHIENHACQVVVMFYLDDVPPSHGGLLVWPGSHKPVYTAHDKKFDFSANERFLEVFRQYTFQPPFEITGCAGDVAFFHHRLFHSGSNNFGRSVRFGVLNDFIPGNYDEIRHDEPTADNMWEYWSDGVQRVANRLGERSPLTSPRPDYIRKLLIGGQRAIRRIRGAYLDEYEEKLAKDAVRNAG